MRLFNAFLITVLSLTLSACGNSSSQKSQLTISTSAEKNVATLGDQISLTLNNPRNLDITKVDYFMDGKSISKNITLSNMSLGVHDITAKVSFDETSEELSTKVTVLNNITPKVYGYKIVNTYPHDINSYTQGLEFHNGELYESTGQYGSSKLRKVDYKTGEVLQNIDLAQQYFAEGLTIFNDKIYQLTWRENIGFIYDVNSFERISSFTYAKSPEGWGICNDGNTIYKSDGTENIWILNPETLEETSKVQVYTHKGKIIGLNELEYINGRIYSNRYQKNGVAIINPDTGGIEGVIDFTPLRKLVTQHDQLDVLNGIAYNPETETIFVTGKLWDKLFEVEVFEK